LLCCDLGNMLTHRSLESDGCVFLPSRLIAGILRFAAAGTLLVAPVLTAKSDPEFPGFPPGSDNLVVSESVYVGYPSLIIPGTTVLPTGVVAIADGGFPEVFNNATVDSSFGITAPIYLLELTSNGEVVGRLPVPTKQMTTSFSSKSELGLHLAVEDFALTFMGYVAPVNTLDVSNSNTPGHFDPSNPVPSTYQRAIGLADGFGQVWSQPVNSYSGNNGRGVILLKGTFYMTGNAGNGSTKGLPQIVDNTGVQILQIFGGSDSTVVGQLQGMVGAPKGFQYGYSVTQYGYPADTSGKDDNFRGITIFNGTLYVTKGSGGNGINTVFQVGTPGVLPTFASAATTQISILPGFSTTLAKSTTGTVYYPFGIWFANPTTLYVADEGDGVLGHAAAGTGGLQKWVLVGNSWQLAYTLTAGLNLGRTYTVPGYPTGINTVTGLNWAPAPDGLRQIAGKVNQDGTVTIYAVTSTVSGSGDQGADPNQLVVITNTPGYRESSFRGRLRRAFVSIGRVFNVKKVDLNRQPVVPQSFEVSLCCQTLLDLLLEICFGLSINIQVTLQDLSLFLGFVVKVYFGTKEPFTHLDQCGYAR
jgi:hypothetical protein